MRFGRLAAVDDRPTPVQDAASFADLLAEGQCNDRRHLHHLHLHPAIDKRWRSGSTVFGAPVHARHRSAGDRLGSCRKRRGLRLTRLLPVSAQVPARWLISAAPLRGTPRPGRCSAAQPAGQEASWCWRGSSTLLGGGQVYPQPGPRRAKISGNWLVSLFPAKRSRLGCGSCANLSLGSLGPVVAGGQPWSICMIGLSVDAALIDRRHLGCYPTG